MADSSFIQAQIAVPVTIANGGTGQITASAAFDALAPSQTGNSGKFLTTNGTTASWGAISVTGYAKILAQSTTQASVTGTTSETTLATYTLLANTLPANGVLRITTHWSRNAGGTGNITNRIRFGGIAGTIYGTAAEGTTSVGTTGVTFIIPNNSTSAQKSQTNSITTPYSNNNAGTTVSSSVNTTSNVDIVFTAALANTGDTGSLEYYTIELLTP